MILVAGEAGCMTHIVGGVMQRGGLNVTGDNHQCQANCGHENRCAKARTG
jgi:hypothetical protein